MHCRGLQWVYTRASRRPPRKSPTRMRFSEIAEKYLNERIPKEVNRRKLGIMFNSELLPVLGDLALEDITRDHVLLICRRIDRRGAPRQARDAGHLADASAKQ